MQNRILRHRDTQESDMTTQTIGKILTRDFILGSSAQFTFMMVFYILVPTLPIYLSRSGADETEIGFLIGIFFVSALVSQAFCRQSPSKNSRKNLYDRRRPSLCSHLLCLSPGTSILAVLDSQDLSRDCSGLVPYGFIYTDRQYQPKGPLGTKLQLLFSGLQSVAGRGSSRWNVHCQSL